MITLMDEAFFKYLPDQNQILFLTFANNLDYICSLKSKQYSHDLNQLLTKEIDHSQFKLLLTETAFQEFEMALLKLKRFGIFKSDNETTAIEGPGLVFLGDFFTFQIESLVQNINVSATTYSEGEACDPVGMSYCETNSQTFEMPRERWDCISGSPNNWSAMGQSC